jgi:hypothetical protein
MAAFDTDPNPNRWHIKKLRESLPTCCSTVQHFLGIGLDQQREPEGIESTAQRHLELSQDGISELQWFCSFAGGMYLFDSQHLCEGSQMSICV